jgi:hypothetical protein
MGADAFVSITDHLSQLDQQMAGLVAAYHCAASVNTITGLFDEVFARTDASGVHVLTADALGSTLALTDGGGTIQTQYTYEPFGSTPHTAFGRVRRRCAWGGDRQ